MHTERFPHAALNRMPRQAPGGPRVFRGTMFYPHGDADDRVTAIGPVRPVRFQTVVPRYDLSTNATRDSGFGPLFDAYEAWEGAAVRRRGPGDGAPTTPRRARLLRQVGTRFDQSV